MSPDATPRGLVGWFAANSVAANLLMAFILIVGAVSAMNLRKESFPVIAPNEITVSVFYDSGSARQAEENIAVKIEETLQNVSGIRKTTSTSTATGTTVTIEARSGVNINQLLNDVKAEVDAIPTLPARAERPVIRAQQWDEHAVWIQVFGDADQTLLQRAADDIRQRLLNEPTISKVSVSGRQNPEITIEVNEAELQAYDLTLADVSRVIAAESFTEVGGSLRSGDAIIHLKADQQRYRYRDFANIVVMSLDDGSRVRLSDVATITDGFDTSPHTWMRFAGKPSVGLQILMGAGDDIVTVVEKVGQVVEAWRASPGRPPSVEVTTWNDRSESILNRLSTLFSSGFGGLLLVIAILTLFLNLRVAFWVAMGLPICFAGAMIVMGDTFVGVSLNELTTFGFIMAMGIIVDDAIVVGENIHTHRIRHGQSLQSTVNGVREVSVPTIFGALTTVAAFGSLMLVEGEFGQIFALFGVVVAAALVFSIIESKLILPAHLTPVSVAEPNPRHPIEWLRTRVDRGLQAFKTRYFIPLLRAALHYRYAALLLFAAALICTMAMVANGTIRSVFFPSIPTNVIIASFGIEQDGSYALTEAALNRIEEEAHIINQSLTDEFGLDLPVIRNIRAQMTDDLTGEVLVELSDPASRTIGASAIANRWRTVVGLPEGVRYLTIASDEGAPEGLMIELGADNARTLNEAALSVLAELEATPGVLDISHNVSAGVPQIKLTLTDAGRALGMSAQDLAEQVQQAFFGFETQRIQRGIDEIRVRVRYPDEARRNLTDLWKMRVRTPAGNVVPLDTVATPTTSFPTPETSRLRGRSVATIFADVDLAVSTPARVIATFEAGVFQTLRSTYPGLSIDLGGEAEEADTIIASLIQVAVLAMMMIYTLIAIPLKSYLQPIVIMIVIPFGFIGAVLGHALHGLPISLLSMFGLIALTGVVVNDALLLLYRYNQIKEHHENMTAALLATSSDRLRAIVLTSITTFAGLLPLMAQPSEQAQYLKPAAASLAYGILIATAITLLLIPVLIRVGEDIKSLWWRLTTPDETPEAGHAITNTHRG